MTSAVATFLDHLRQAFAQQRLVKLTLGEARGSDPTLRNVYVRPVALRAGPRLSFCFRHTTRDLTRNYEFEEASAEVGRLLGASFGSAHLFTTEAEIELRWPIGGEPGLRRGPPRHSKPASTAHDRPKVRQTQVGAPWLHALGLTTPDGQVRTNQAAKFRQVHRFLEILGHGLEPLAANLLQVGRAVPSPPPPVPSSPSLRLVDMGCGKGYLTFAAHDWLRRNGWTPEVLGIESRADLVEFCNGVARELGCDGLSFCQGTISETSLDGADVLVALHACDTATDDALAKGIQAGVRLILVAPCCHQELRPQLQPPLVLERALRHGIFRERQAEFVTDALRAGLLEWAGYQARVFEFIAAEHTAKNLMIAATKRPEPDSERPARAAAVQDLARAYGLRTQRLAQHLGFELSPPGTQWGRI